MDMIYGLRINPIKNVAGSVKGIWLALASWALLQVLPLVVFLLIFYILIGFQNICDS